jgi:hypothetical protein
VQARDGGRGCAAAGAAVGRCVTFCCCCCCGLWGHRRRADKVRFCVHTRVCNSSWRTHSCRPARSAAQDASCHARARVPGAAAAARQVAGAALLVPAVISAHAHTCACLVERVSVCPAQAKTPGVTAAAQQAAYDEYGYYYAPASDGYDADGDDAFGASGCHARWQWGVCSHATAQGACAHTRASPHLPPPPCTHARPLTGKDADGHKTCATLGAACTSNRDCCHDFLCARDPGGYGRRCEWLCWGCAGSGACLLPWHSRRRCLLLCGCPRTHCTSLRRSVLAPPMQQLTRALTAPHQARCP